MNIRSIKPPTQNQLPEQVKNEKRICPTCLTTRSLISRLAVAGIAIFLRSIVEAVCTVLARFIIARRCGSNNYSHYLRWLNRDNLCKWKVTGEGYKHTQPLTCHAIDLPIELSQSHSSKFYCCTKLGLLIKTKLWTYSIGIIDVWKLMYNRQICDVWYVLLIS